MRLSALLHGLLVGAIMLCLPCSVHADELEYKYEVGVMVGGSSYYGDANYTSLMKNMNMM